MGPDHPSNSSDFIEQLLALSVSGAVAPWPRAAGEGFVDALVEAAHDHGVAALLARAVSRQADPSWIPPLRDRLRAHVTAEAATEVLRRAEVERVV